MNKLLLFAVASAALAQPLAFDAASVKPNTSGRTGMRGGPNQVQFENFSLRRLIQVAYSLPDYAYSAPAWLDSVHFDIIARFPTGVTPDRMPEMLRTLLAERFKVVVHRESKEVGGLALSVDRKGLQIQPVEPGVTGSSSGPAMAAVGKGSMADFAHALEQALNVPVRDKTGLAGVYDIKIRWLPDGTPPPDTTGMASSVYEAVNELGLKLQARKVTIQILVIDSAERAPTEN